MSPRTVASLVVACALAGPIRGEAPAVAPESLDAVREAVAKWRSTEELLYKEKKDWQQGQEMLASRIDAAEEEVADLEAKLAESQKTRADLGAKHTAAAVEDRRLAASSDELVQTIERFEGEVRGLVDLVPAPVRERVEPLYRRIPEPGVATSIAVAERYQNVLGILNEMHKANGEISLVSEIRKLADGRPSETKAVYIGLGQAYYLSAGGEAGIGRPGPSGWSWETSNDLAPRIAEVIEILESKAKPKFVPLPVTIR